MIVTLINSLLNNSSFLQLKLAKMTVLASNDLTTAKKLPTVELHLIQEIITGLGV